MISLLFANGLTIRQLMTKGWARATVENTVYVADGEAVMIGGIIQETKLETVNKVPWLGDIPVLGWAFKGTNESVMKTNLIIVLTPTILRDRDDLRQLTI